jgi:hypothetical protein
MQMWAEQHKDLLPRQTFVAGDMFKADTIPHAAKVASGTVAAAATATATAATATATATAATAAAGDVSDKVVCKLKGKVAYMLRNVLHDWGDAECIAILRAVRSRVPEDMEEQVVLLLVETTTAEDHLKCLMPHRRRADITMLMTFGYGKERSLEQFEMLFRASGWRLTRVVPSTGLLNVVEAQPAAFGH